MMENTIIAICTCKHEFQDNRYGKNKRVMNPTSKYIGTQQVYRCTVCSKEHLK